ncbi:hypothetical protein LIER_32368 [Lithospermum erythrorhizon]|uniref:Uncharacterized protein n=1 Tax=Lithospermum erythrorhizon TaxID=34254 RepID=A0AAV3RW32_LITER
MSSCNPSSTPIDTKPKLGGSSGTPCVDPLLFHSLVGALQYLTFTITDISCAVQQICLFMHAPMTSHMLALKRIGRAAPIHVNPPLVFVYYSEIILSPSLLSTKRQYPGPVLKPNIVALPIVSRKHVGYVIYC